MVPSRDTQPLSLTVQVKERGREQLASLRTEAAMSGKWAAILSASGWASKVVLEAKESADSLGERRGRFRKSLTRRNRNGGIWDRGLCLTTLLSLSKGCGSLSVGGGGLRGHAVGGSPVGVQITGGPGGAWGVFPFGELFRFPGGGVLLGKRLRVAI